MAKQLTITIPDDLFERLQVVKSRFNVSGVCQEAIMTAVNIEEHRSKENPNQADVIERLKAEKAEFDEQWGDLGERDGYDIADRLSYEEFIDIETHGLNQRMHETDVLYTLDICFEDTCDDHPGIDKGTYSEGWEKGVRRYWEEVKGEL